MAEDDNNKQSGSPGTEPARNGPFLVVVFLAALMIRGAFVLTREGGLEFPDEASYMAVAKNFLEGKGLIMGPKRQIVRAPLYPLFVALCRSRFAPDDIVAIRLIQCVIGALTCLLVYRLGRVAFNAETGWIAAAIAAVYPFFVFYCGLLLTETLFTFLFVLLMCSLLQLRARLGVWRSIWTGAVWGACVLLRASMLTFVAFLLPFWLISVERKVRGLLCWSVCVLAGALIMSPWVYRNYVITNGKFVPTTLMVGESLFEANSELATGGPALDIVEFPKEAAGMNEYDRDRFLFRQAVGYMFHHPHRTISLAIEKFRRTWNVFPNYEGYRSNFYRVVSAASYGPVLLLALIGLVGFARPGRVVLLLCVPLIYFALLHSIFVGSTRYRTPLMSVWMVLAACPLRSYFLWTRSKYRDDGARDVRTTQRRLRARLALALGIVAVAAVGLLFAKRSLKPENARKLAEDTLTRLFHSSVSIGSVRITPIGALQINQFATKTSVPGGEPAFISIKQLTVRASLASLLRMRPAPSALDVKGFRLDNALNPKRHVKIEDVIQHVARLLQSLGAPSVLIRDGRVHISEEDKTIAEVARLRVVLVPEHGSRGLLSIRGVADEARFGRFDIAGGMNVNVPTLRLRLSRRRMPVSEKFLQVCDFPFAQESVIRPTGGTIDLALKVAYDPREDKEARSQVRIDVRDAALRIPELPQPITSIHGHVDIDRNQVLLQGIAGRFGDAPVRLLDAIIPLKAGSGFQVVCYISDFAFDKSIARAGSRKFREVMEALRPRGRADGEFYLFRNPGPSEPLQWRLMLSCRQGTLCHKAFPVRVHNVTGTIEVTESYVRLSNMRGEHAGQPVRMSETVIPFAREAPYELRIKAASVPFDDELYRALRSDAQRWWQILNPSKSLGIEWRLYQLPGELYSREQLMLDLSGAQIMWKKLATPISLDAGTVVSNESAIRISGLRGRCAGATLSLSGILHVPVENSPADLDFGMWGVRFGKKVKQALPEKYHALWDRLDPKGFFDLRVRLAIEPLKDNKVRTFAYHGQVAFQEAHFSCGVDIDKATGTVYFQGTATGHDNIDVKGNVALKNVILDNKRITDLRARFTQKADLLELQKVRGECYKGLITGGASIHGVGKKGVTKFYSYFRLRDLNIGELTKASPIPVEHMEGILGAENSFSGEGDVNQLRGYGSIQIRKGKLGELPRLLGLMNLFRLASINAPAFHSADIKYEVSGDHILVRDISLKGDVLSLHGKGEVTNGKLDFRFVPEVGPRLPLIGTIMDKTRINELIRILKNRLIPVKLKGSYADPIWRLDPLTSVARTVQGIFQLRRPGLPTGRPSRPKEGGSSNGAQKNP